MKKIMFNDKYGLTKAVLEGRKTQTRRVATIQQMRTVLGFPKCADYNMDELAEACAISFAKSRFSPYMVGGEVAVAQSYKDCLNSSWIKYIHDVDPTVRYDRELSLSPGQDNKMFVRADLMPHHIKITNVRVERLQDISDEDCLEEGIIEDLEGVQYSYPTNIGYCGQYPFDTPKEAFAALIDKTCGKGTWESNPWVFVYDFELVK